VTRLFLKGDKMHKSNYDLMIKNERQIENYIHDTLGTYHNDWLALSLNERIQMLEMAVNEKGLIYLLSYIPKSRRIEK
jgi:hypothetical protein